MSFIGGYNMEIENAKIEILCKRRGKKNTVDFECIWEKPFTKTLDRNKDNQFKVTEKLFTYRR